MANGRPADPSRARRGTGNHHGPDAAPQDLARLTHALPEIAAPPAELPESVHEVWNVSIAEMAGNGHLRPSDLVQLRVYCEAVYAHSEASANVHKYGVLVKGPSGAPVPNPMLRVQKDAAATIRQVSDVLGLNPLARIRAGLMQIAGASLLTTLNQQLDE